MVSAGTTLNNYERAAGHERRDRVRHLRTGPAGRQRDGDLIADRECLPGGHGRPGDAVQTRELRRLKRDFPDQRPGAGRFGPQRNPVRPAIEHAGGQRQREAGMAVPEAGFAELAKGVLHNLGNAMTPISVRLANLTDSQGGDAADRVINAMSRLTPAA